MIEIIQAGQFGKTRSLIDMHKTRKKIFKDRMGWDVDITKDGLEIDDYDLPESVYILVRGDDGDVAGVWRLLPSSSPSMIRNIWPDFLENFNMPISDRAWEVSRFGVFIQENNSKKYLKAVNKITAKLIMSLLEVCNLVGIDHIYTMYNVQVERSVRKIGFYAEERSKEIVIDGKRSIVGRVKTDFEALKRVQESTGINLSISYDQLPPILKETYMKNDDSYHTERISA